MRLFDYLKQLKAKQVYTRTPFDWIVVYFFAGFGIIGGVILTIASALCFLFCLIFGSGMGVTLSLVLMFLFIALVVVSFAVSKYLNEDWW